MMKQVNVKQYLLYLAKGFLIMLMMLTWSLKKVHQSWVLPITPGTIWTLLSWLLCYPSLRKRYAELFRKNDDGMASYKNRALKLHQQDISNNHKNRRWTNDGVATNPWSFQYLGTQTTDEILNPILIFCEHLWATFLLILFGPLIVLILGFLKLVKHLIKRAQ